MRPVSEPNISAKFRKAVVELDLTVGFIQVIETALDSLLAFMAGALILSLLSLDVRFALIPAAIVMAITGYTRFSEDKPWMVESIWESMRERLRTAHDSMYIQNEVADELRKEVITDLKAVRVSRFASLRSIAVKTAGIMGISFLLVIFAMNNLAVLDMTVVASEFGRIRFTADAMVGGGGGSNAGSGGDRGDIFGEDHIAALGDQEIQVELTMGGFEITGMSEEDPPRREFEEAFPTDADFADCSNPPCVLSDDVPVDQQELVREYFIKLSSG